MKKSDKKKDDVGQEQKGEEKDECNCGNCECSDEDKKDTCNCDEEKEQLQNQVKRALADYQNLEKRVQEQKGEWARSANRDLLIKLLPVLDTLILAQKHDKSETLQVTVTQFIDALTEAGVERIKTVGEKFDPHTMECIQTIAGEEGKVLEETRAGYVLYDKVLRPAQVIVGGGLAN